MSGDLNEYRAGEIRPPRPGSAAFDHTFQTSPESSLARYILSVFLLSLAKEPGPRARICPLVSCIQNCI